MLYNSIEFLLVLLPLTLAAVAVAVRLKSANFAIVSLLIASYAFYGYSEHHVVLLLAASTAFNYAAGRVISRAVRNGRIPLARTALAAGVAGNLALLGYFKYAGFLVANLDWAAGLDWSIPSIVLPVGISFYTFTQTAFLVDCFRGETAELRLADYFLFVAYFPHLVAGPIIHYRQTMPQFRGMAAGWNPETVAVGLSIFTVGLFKKIAIADLLAPHADAGFARASVGNVAMLDGWSGALAYSFQIYFDFSGYSDMAIGLSLLFGVRLPVNFYSPYKACSIVEFWMRWHISLSQFLRDYLYIPLGGNRKGPARRYVNLMVTMLLGGLWHGATWGFVLWGGLHGIFLTINHFLRRVRPRPSGPSTGWALWLKRGGVFLAVTVAWVLFRADSPASALAMLRGMCGLHGIGAADPGLWLGLLACLLIVWLLPNTRQIFARFNPTLPVRAEIAELVRPALAWRANALCAVAAGVTFALCVLAIGKFSPFLYFRF